MTLPGAQIVSFDDATLPDMRLEDTSHYQITRGILDSPERYWNHLRADGDTVGNVIPESVISAVCRMPVAFRSGESTSMATLFEQSGCANHMNSMTADVLAAFLRQRQELIDAWVIESCDRRTGSGPYLEEPRSDGRPWVVGDYPSGEQVEYTDGASACAAFILRRLHELAGSGD